MTSLHKKKILVMMPDMYHYPQEIKNALNKLGADVFLYGESPQDLISRVVRNVSPTLYKKKAKKFLNRILYETKSSSLDFILVIKGILISEDFILQLKKNHPNAKFIMYQWDSHDLHPYFHLIDFFDKSYVFDSSDAKRSDNLIYHPLFFVDDYRQLRTAYSEKRYDFAHIGTLHLGRYETLHSLIKEFNLNGYSYLYVAITRWLKYALCGRLYFDVKFNKLSNEKILKLYSKAESVLDLPQNRQTGLTMRTIETLGAYKKLITTNIGILNEEIYNKELVYILNYDKRPIKDFLYKPVVVSEEYKVIIEKYSVYNWLLEMLK